MTNDSEKIATTPDDTMRQLRVMMVDRTLWTIVILAGIVQVAVNVEEFQRGRYGTIAIYLGLYSVLVIMAVNKSFPYVIRALAAPVILYFVAVSELWLYTIVSNAVLYLFVTVILTGIFIGFRAGFAALMVSIATLIAFAYIYVVGILPPEPQPDHLLLTRPDMAKSPVNWIAIGVPFVFVSGSLLACLMVMMRALVAKTHESAALVYQLRTEVEQHAEAERALQNSERGLREAQEIVRLGSYEWIAESDSMSWSDELFTILGFPQGTIPSREQVVNRIVEEDRGLAERAFDHVARHGGADRVEFRVTQQDGSTGYLVARARADVDDSGRVIRIAGTVQDRTERVLADAHERELEEQLRQSQKMEAIGQLAGGIAHDFNNILQSLLGYCRLAQNSDKSDENIIDECLKEIEMGGQRAADLVSQLLDFARAENTFRKPLDLGMAVEQALKLLRSTLPSTIEITDQLEADCPHILADQTQVQQIVLNLCTNASHAVEPQGGSIHIAVKHEQIDQELLAVTGVVEPGEYAVLTVTDTGHGIADHDIERIFEPFFTTKELGKGTGLGLSMVHGIATSMGAAIDVKSRIGKGTSFHVYFPIATEPHDPEELPDTRSTTEHEDTGRILLVDDEPAIVKLFTMALERRGFSVSAFTSAPSALECFKETPNAFDIVITDLTMPVINGLELAAKVRALNESLPIVLNTGQHHEDMVPNPHISAVLRKPVQVEDMVTAIHHCLSQ